MRHRQYLLALGTAFLLFIIALITTYYATIYATEKASSPVTDIVLSNIPVIDVDGLFLYGPVIFWIIMIAYFLWDPRKIPFALKSIAIFVLIRAGFISLTHIGPFFTQATINTNGLPATLAVFATGNDLFFSSHTGLPFLMALINWQNKYLRYFCLAASVFFGAVVLLGHFHYSIDVVAAFFITYAIFHITEWAFKKDRQIFLWGFKD